MRGTEFFPFEKNQSLQVIRRLVYPELVALMERDDFMCRNCGNSEKTLHIDHKIYRKNYEPWEYPDDDLQTLCEDCHEEISSYRKNLAESIGYMNTFELEQLTQFIPKAPIADTVLIVHNLSMISMSLKDFNRMMEIVQDWQNERDQRTR